MEGIKEARIEEELHNIKLKNLVLEYTGWNMIADQKFAVIGQNGDFSYDDSVYDTDLQY